MKNHDLTVTLPRAAGVATYPAGATFGPRRLRDFEFVWIIEGDILYRHHETIMEASPGSVVLCRPDATDFFRWDPAARTRHAYFHFEVPTLPPREVWPLARKAAEDDILLPLFRYILTWTGHGDPVTIRTAISSLLAAFITGETATGSITPRLLPEPVDRVLAYIKARIETNPAAEIRLQDLADAACVTPEHLCRLFRTALSHSPMETVRLLRLDRSTALLTHSNYSISEIAELCGFASPFHYSRVFRAAYGQSPTEVRRAVQSGEIPPISKLTHIISLVSE